MMKIASATAQSAVAATAVSAGRNNAARITAARATAAGWRSNSASSDASASPARNCCYKAARQSARPRLAIGALTAILLGSALLQAGSVPQSESPARQRQALWQESTTVTGEPVLFIRHADGSSSGQLLRSPAQILRVYSPHTGQNFPPQDFASDADRTLTYTGKAPIPHLAAADLYPETKTPTSIDGHTDGKRHLLYLEGGFHARQLLIDYHTTQPWPAAIAPSQSAAFTRLNERLQNGSPVTIVLLGDSISRGANHRHAPAYIEQVADYLRSVSTSEITVHNLSVGGKSSPWGLQQAEKAAALKPDLFIVAFGMNDASGGYPAEKYAQTIRSLPSTVRAKSPATECLLVSGMDANPEWNKAAPELHAAYHKQLQTLCEEIPATALCDVYTPWQILAARKGFHSLTGNGVNHPNDYGHRLYADSVLQAILPQSAFPQFPALPQIPASAR